LNKDNLLFAIIGILVGFFAGYLLQEAMSARQPPRLVQGQGAPASETPEMPETTAMPAGPGGGQAPAGMAEIQQLRQYVEQNPNDADAVRQLANLNFDISNWQRAQELYSRYLELRPGDPDVLSDLGISYRGNKDFDKALETFRKAQQVAPEHWQAYYNEVVVLAFDMKRFDAAGEVLDKLRRMQPDNENVAKLAAEVERQRNSA
jgi:uncharacterized protein HemY